MQQTKHSEDQSAAGQKSTVKMLGLDVIDELVQNGARKQTAVNAEAEHWRAVALASLFSQGCTPEEISTLTGLAEPAVEKELGSSRVEQELGRIAVRLDLPVEEFIAGSEKQAAWTVRQLLIAKGVRDETRLKAAQDIIDRSKGRAVQRVQAFNVNSDVKDLGHLNTNIAQATERIKLLEQKLTNARKSA